MTDKKIVNKPASVKAKLLHISNREHIEFNTLMRKYFQERFLHRLSLSKYKDKFILKGGLLLVSIDTPSSRPTMDIDFLADKIKNDVQIIESIFKEIALISSDDGIIFDPSSVKTEVIAKEADYNGLRLKMEGALGQTKEYIQADLGFGDVIYPSARDIAFPSILGEEKTALKGYPLETVVAEKFEAMIKMGLYNSRMKDFFDVYTIFKTGSLSQSSLKTAIFKTFENRHTFLPQKPIIFTSEFYKDANKQVQWAAFLRKSAIKTFSLSFEEVVLAIKAVLWT